MALPFDCEQLKEDEPRLIGALSRMGALINKDTFKGGAYSKRCASWKEGAKSNHYGFGGHPDW